jgi:pimeloyl-ACP methyl ester carboxylesterase
MLIAAGLVAIIVIGLAVLTMVGTRAIERAHPPSGRFITVDGARLHVLELGPAGDGLPIVMLHGASGTLEDMRLALGERLALGGQLAAGEAPARRHRVILIDRPGHGWSDASPTTIGPGRQAALIAKAFDVLGVPRAIVVAHSWSGALATALALDHPQRVAALVLTAPVTHPWIGGVSWYYEVATLPLIGPLFTATVALPLGSLLMDAASAKVFAPQPLPKDYTQRAGIRMVLRPVQFAANARDVKALKAHVTAQAPRYRELTMPITVFTADKDTIVPPETHARPFAAAVPGVRLIEVKDAGHGVHHVAAERIVAEIERLATTAAE